MKDTKNFSSKEFECPCCGFECMNQELVDLLQELRDRCGFALKITSATRCKKHNVEVGGVPNSEHVPNPETLGVDIYVADDTHRYAILNAAIKLGFMRIGVGKHLIHLGINGKLPTRVLWMYQDK
jgi:hypothetical protein